MNQSPQSFDANVEISESRIRQGIENAEHTNRTKGRTWGVYVVLTIGLFELTQEMFDPAINEQMNRLNDILPDIQIAEGLMSAELPELKRASILAIQRALLARRQSMDL